MSVDLTRQRTAMPGIRAALPAAAGPRGVDGDVNAVVGAHRTHPPAGLLVYDDALVVGAGVP